MWYVIEPVALQGEGEYNLNVLQDIEVTESYLGLDQNIRRCQNAEPYDNCTTRHYIDALMKECKCLPFSIAQFSKVMIL